MSRFDRRLKGTGLRPGEATCKLRNGGNTPMMRSQNEARTMTMNVQKMAKITGQNIISNGNQFQPTGILNNWSNEKINADTELQMKNSKLEEYARTCGKHEIKLITRHEIRLNKLEAYTVQMPGKTDNLLGEINYAKLVNDMKEKITPELNPLTSEKKEELKKNIMEELMSQNNMLDIAEKVSMTLADKFNDNKNTIMGLNVQLQNQLGVMKAMNGQVLKLKEEMGKMKKELTNLREEISHKAEDLTFEIKENELPKVKTVKEKETNDIRNLVMKEISKREKEIEKKNKKSSYNAATFDEVQAKE
jgi:hypothetical protein